MNAEPAQPRGGGELGELFARLCRVERGSRVLEALALGAATSWTLLGLAQAAAEGSAALVPALVAGALAGACWLRERWRNRRALAARTDRALAAHELVLTALEPASGGAAPAWGELLERRALALWDRARLWRAVRPSASVLVGLLLVAFGARELLERGSRGGTARLQSARDWSTLAEAVEAGAPAAAAGQAAERGELARALREAAARERRGELDLDLARELLERANAAGIDAPVGPRADAGASELRAARERLALAHPRPTPLSSPSAPGPGAGSSLASGGSSPSVPGSAPDGTMSGSTAGGASSAAGAPAGTGSGAAAAPHAALSARWWPSEQTPLVEAWLERQARNRSPR